jgi:hypothetical protein
LRLSSKVERDFRKVTKEWRFAYAITGENAGLLYEGLIHSWPVAR